MKTVYWLVLSLFLLLAGCTAAAAPHSPLDEIAGYDDWTTLTDKPRDVSSYIVALCRMPTDLETGLTTSQHGWSRLVWDFVNEAGLSAIHQDGARTFPVGSIIVKEKYLEPADREADALGIMIKRAAGSNPEGSDWEFLYWERETGLQRDAEHDSACQKCHAAVSDADFVFYPRSASDVGY